MSEMSVMSITYNNTNPLTTKFYKAVRRAVVPAIMVGASSLASANQELPSIEASNETTSFSCDQDISSLTRQKQIIHSFRSTVAIKTFASPVEEEKLSDPVSIPTIGTGFIIDADQRLIATNSHVALSNDEIYVRLYDPSSKDNAGEFIKASLLGTDKHYDVAILKIDDNVSANHCLQFADSGFASLGQSAYGVGHPRGLNYSIAGGIISDASRFQTDESFGLGHLSYIQTDVSINPGNSGGPLLNEDFQVIGVNTFIISDSRGANGLSFGIKSNDFTMAANEILKFGEVRRGTLGLEKIENANQGAVILDDIKPDSIAGKIGLQKSDVITHINGHEVQDTIDLKRAIYQRDPYEVVAIDILREDEEGNNYSVLVTAELGDLTAYEAQEKFKAAESDYDREKEKFVKAQKAFEQAKKKLEKADQDFQNAQEDIDKVLTQRGPDGPLGPSSDIVERQAEALIRRARNRLNNGEGEDNTYSRNLEEREKNVPVRSSMPQPNSF